MKKQYTQPELYVENVVVESGIAVSSGSVVYGDFGAAGQGGEISNYDDEF